MKFLMVLGSGGHTEQMLRLVDLLGNKHEYEYIIAEEDLTSEKRIEIPGRIFRMPKTRKIRENFVAAILKQFFGCFFAFKILINSKSKIILTCGPHIAAPVCFVGKLLGKKIIFVESWSRVYSKSNTGKFIYLFADQFFVQWPEQLKNYPRAVYAGRLR